MIAANPQYAPEFILEIDGSEVPTPIRACITSIRLTSGMEGADRVEFTLFNERLRWLDHPLFATTTPLVLRMGYHPGPMEVMFGGEIVGVQASFPSGGTPTLQVNAQDRLHRLQKGLKSRWFSKETEHMTNVPVARKDLASSVADAHDLKLKVDPAGQGLSQLVGDVVAILTEAIGALDPGVSQKAVDTQIRSRDYDLMKRLARENGFDLMLDHTGKTPGKVLLFFAPWEHLDAEVSLVYGRSLLDFSPRESDVGQIAKVTANVWRPEARETVAVTLSWNPGDRTLALVVLPGKAKPAEDDSDLVIDKPLTSGTAPRELVSQLVPKLNSRSTCSGSAVGDPRLRPGAVIAIGGVGERFGGFYRVTSATHSIDSGGYKTQFEGRKEIWFKQSKVQQGAIRVDLPSALGHQAKL